MSSRIWIASKPVNSDYEHLYLVYDPDGNPSSGDELVFRGGPEGDIVLGNIEIENWKTIGASEDSLGGLDSFGDRNYTELNLKGLTPEQFKDGLSLWANSLGAINPESGNIATDIPYTLPITVDSDGEAKRKPSLNSNTTIKSAIESIGIDFQSNIPRDGGVGPRLPSSKFPGAESYYTASDSTVNISDTTDRSVKSVGGNNTYVVDANSFNRGKVKIMEDGDAGTLDKILLKNINPSDVRLERTLGGDLNIYFPWDADGDPSIVIPNQWQNGVPSINNLWVYPPDGSAPQVIALNLPDSIPLDLPDFLPARLVPAGGIFGDVPAIPILRGWGDPLVLDLDGDGVEVTKMGFGTDRSMVYFDMDNDGFAERTAWATGGDGLLALDKNGNGKIDNQGELFGNTNTLADGFLNLKQYDSNADNKITSADGQFANLRVWVDADKDGQTDAGELKTLADLKITQINLGATILSNVSNNENTVAATSSFVMNGVTKTISEVWFRNDAMDTRYLGDVTLDVRTLFLPTLKGFGNLKDLHVAMSQDTALLTLVQNFTAGWSTKKFGNPTALNNEVRAILYKWAGVDTVVDGSRGTFIDAKILSFMEALTGEPYGSNSTLGFTQPSHAVHVPPVMNAFEIAFDSLKAHLLTQAGAGSLFVAAPVYNIASGDLSAGELSLSAINALRTEALTLDSSARGGFWSSVGEYVLNVRDKASLSTAEVNALNSAIVDSGIGQTWESVSNAVLAQYPSSYRATNLSDYVLGGQGNDGLNGLAGDDVIGGLAGNDNLSGGAGSDTYKFSVGDGVDIIYEESGAADVVLMGAGITAANIRFEKSSYDLNIYYGTSDKITLYSQFYDDMRGSSSCDEVETLKFADGSTINLKSGLTFTGTTAADSVVGTSMADSLVGLGGADGFSGYGGDDVLIGGTGNDTLSGGAGSDTYKFSVGDGVDTISEESGTADVVLMGAGITAANIRFEKSSYDLNIYYGTSDKITLSSQFYDDMRGSSSCDEVETLKFADGSTINLKSGLTFTGTAAADSVVGTTMADSLVGLAGNDSLSGGAGNDTLIGGDGNDYMDGGLGVDTASYAGTSVGVTVSLLTTAAQNTVGAGTDTLTGIENLLGSSYNDTLTGDANANTIEGGLGNDTLNGGAGVDTASYAGTSVGVTVSLLTTVAQNTVGAGTDTLTGIENLLGSSYNDTLTGDANANTIEGGLGNDTLNGGAGVDTVSYSKATAAVTVDLSLATSQNTVGAGSDLLSNFENIFGSAFADTLKGNAGANVISSGSGNDTLYGGLGADSFKFDVSAVGNIDTVKDFKLAEADKLDIRDLLVGYDSLTKAITDFVECTTSGANTIVKVDRDGAGATYGWQQIAVIENVTGLTDEATLKANGTLIA